MLFKLYGSAANEIMTFSISDGVEMCKVAFEKYNDDMLRQRWVLHYENKLSFTEFKEKLVSSFKNQNASEEDNATILANLKNIFG